MDFARASAFDSTVPVFSLGLPGAAASYDHEIMDFASCIHEWPLHGLGSPLAIG
jgi:hypothetical protein